MNVWLLTATILFVPLLGCGAVCTLAGPADALVALEVAGMIVTAMLLALCEGLHRQPFVDLALVFALLAFAGSLTFARMLERRL